jgi:translocation and assembly module TamB
MSEPDSISPVAGATPEDAPPGSRWSRRLRRFFLHHLPLTIAAAALLVAIAVVGLYLWASSAGFENFVRKEMILKIEDATGGRVEIASFHWNLLHLQAEADELIIHGLEARGEAPYAQAESLRVRVSILGLWSPHIRLSDLEILRPRLHLIVYPDGTTNQPQPRRRKRDGKPVLDQFFDLRARRVEVVQGLLDYENRAAAFDFQDRFIPLDFTASDLSLRMAYLPATRLGLPGGNPESYHIEAGVRDLTLARGDASMPAKTRPPAVEGYLQATLDLTRDTAALRSLRVTAGSRGVSDRTLLISGFLDHFAHPRWQAKADGELDMRLLDPITGYPHTPQGIAQLHLAASGETGSFRLDGGVHVDGGSYIGTGVVASGFVLDARVHADPDQLLITSINTRLRQGGQINGDLSLLHWLPPHSLPANVKRRADLHLLSPSDVITIPVDGKVTADFNNVALDTLLEMVSDPPFQHLGFDTRINGHANALWNHGDKRTVSVAALLKLTPPAQPAEGMVLASGLVDATYTHRDGAVDLRKLVLDLPSSHLQARGHLGAYPLVSSSALAVDLHTANLGEFDAVLRDLGLSRKQRTGAAALPILLDGPADFHGTWTGSLVDPRLTGNVKTTHLEVESPASLISDSAPPQFLRFDSVEATGSYSAARIVVEQGQLRRGDALLTLNGSLTAATAVSVPHKPAPPPSFNAGSQLQLRLRAAQFSLGDLLPLTGHNLPMNGTLSAQLQLDGPVRAPNGSGWIELDKGTLFGEPVARIRAQGSVANQIVKLTSMTASEDTGKIAASGSYDLQSRRLQLEASGAGIDAAGFEWPRRNGLAVTGKLGFTLHGEGSFDDPRLDARATLAGLTINGDPLGALELRAQTANRSATYNLTTRLEEANLNLHGQTALTGDYATQANLDFSRFNIAALFRMAKLPGLGSDSALAGTVTVEGPLARPEELRGEARIDQLALTVSGVPLRSEGGLHATLDHALIHLDPLRITGDATDLRLQGSLALKNKMQLDLAASGSINLKLAETVDPDITASGTTSFQVEAHGPLSSPALTGRVQFQNAAIALEDLPNGLSQLQGTLEFNQNRLEVRSLTAMSGGGLISVGGFLSYQHGLFANLTATGDGIRIRYPLGVSSQANASLLLQGPRNNLLLSGDVLITRFTVSPSLDIAALAAEANAAQSFAPPDAPSNHVRLDVHITSSPQLSFQNAYAKLAGNVDLRLRGTVAAPSLLGRVSITDGSAILAGTRYELQRGDIYFTNPVRIQPSIDLNATARVEDYDITLGLHGTPEKLAVTYRSDPPLPEADVVALLALGRTESQQRLYTQQQQQALANPTTDALLGGALNATVSNRVQKLFGAGTVKVDPNYLGVLGNSTTRVIVEEQLGSNVTLTYATDVDTTGQQLIQADVAINHHVALVISRDESGVFSVVLKATRRFR